MPPEVPAGAPDPGRKPDHADDTEHVDAAVWRGVLTQAGLPAGTAGDLPLRDLADEVTLLRLLCAAEDAVPGGLPTELLDALDTVGDLAHFVAVRVAAEGGAA